MTERDALAEQLDGQLDRDFILDSLVRLLRVPTHVPLGETLIEPDDPKLVHYVQKVIQPLLEQLTYQNLTVDELNNLIMRYGNHESKRGLLMMAYTPTQHANLMEEPFSGKVQDAIAFGHDELCVFGQGASQNKGALASLLGALKVIKDTEIELNGQLIVVVNNEGRSSHACSKYVLDNQDIQANGGILCIGTENRIALGNRGRVDVNIRVIGKSCHSSQPWRGLNTIEAAHEILSRLKSLAWENKHPQLGRSQLTVYQTSFSPIAPHTIPEEGRLTLDRRLIPGEDPDNAVAEIVNAIGDLSPFQVEIQKGVEMYPAVVSQEAEIVQVLQEAFLAIRGKPSETYYPQWTFDAGYPCSKGIPTIMMGPSAVDPAGEDLMATDFVPISQVEEAAKIYAYTIIRMLNLSE
jgi:acetylornithine deacetylase/succinyl-diaminopimelate desuccinylase-like protein